MIVESFIAKELLDLSQADLEEVCKVFLSVYPKVVIEKEDYQPIIDLLVFDKKNEAGKVLFVLLKKIGEAEFNCEVPSELLGASLDFYNAL